MAAYERPMGQEGQRLLFPLTLRLTPAELKCVEDLSGLLDRAGFEVGGFGGDTVIVHSVPNPHRYFDAERAFLEMDRRADARIGLVRSARNQHERIAMSFACKGAIKAGQRLRTPRCRSSSTSSSRPGCRTTTSMGDRPWSACRARARAQVRTVVTRT
jgi:DNA mismatch repair ATPase MutL